MAELETRGAEPLMLGAVRAEELYAAGMGPEGNATMTRRMRAATWRLLRPFLRAIARELDELADRIDAESERRSELEARLDATAADRRLLDCERRIVELEAGVAALHGQQHLHEARLTALSQRAAID